MRKQLDQIKISDSALSTDGLYHSNFAAERRKSRHAGPLEEIKENSELEKKSKPTLESISVRTKNEVAVSANCSEINLADLVPGTKQSTKNNLIKVRKEISENVAMQSDQASEDA